MQMRTAAVAMTAVSMLALAACNPAPLRHREHHSGSDFVSGFSDGWNGDSGSPLKTVSTLTCPEHEGDLTRTAQAADGKSCDYTGEGGDVVHLSLLALDGRSPADALGATKTALKAIVPPPASSPVNVEASKGDGADKAHVDLPFLHVDAEGDKADVKILGTTIHANGKNAEVHTNMGLKNTTVHAGPGGAEVVAEDVGKVNTSMVYVLAADNPSADGYRAAGYIARGPAAGPLVVAEFRSKREHHGDEGHGDMAHLLDLNLKD